MHYAKHIITNADNSDGGRLRPVNPWFNLSKVVLREMIRNPHVGLVPDQSLHEVNQVHHLQ